MRCFVAVDLAPELKEKAKAVQKGLTGLDTKLVEAGNLHFTIKFLGEIDENTLPDIKKRLSNVTCSSFTLHVEKIGVFPSEDFIRVVWIGSGDLIGLQKEVNELLYPTFKKEKPSPHLTIARVRSQKYKENILGFIEANKNVNIGSMVVHEIKLKKSILTGEGPIYEDVFVVELNERR